MLSSLQDDSRLLLRSAITHETAFIEATKDNPDQSNAMVVARQHMDGYIKENNNKYGTDQMRSVLQNVYTRNNWASQAGFTQEVSATALTAIAAASLITTERAHQQMLHVQVFDQELTNIFNARQVLQQQLDQKTQELEKANKELADLKATLRNVSGFIRLMMCSLIFCARTYRKK